MTTIARYSTKTVWVSYVGYPVTTAVYLERALRRICNVKNIGPPLPPELYEQWQLQNMKAPQVKHDIVTDFTPDMAEILAQHPDITPPDLYLWVESVPGHHPKNITALGCPTACYLIDSHLSLERHLKIAAEFDYIFIAQRAYLEQFREVNPRSYWLPLACDPEIHRDWQEEKQYDIGFVGGILPGSRRKELLERLAERLPVYYERCFWDEMARVFSRCRMVFNNAVRNDLNMRFFEALSTGALLLSDMALDSGQEELFFDGEDYACYHDGNLTEVASFYLENEELRERIARRGKQLAHNAHTYLHRVEDMLAVILDGKPDTFSAAELRHRSVAGLDSPFSELCAAIELKSPRRSFVIPVLDYSPASEYNILTLLKDLDEIEGEVIAVFNGAAVGEELKQHPRITRHAIMKQNVGVPRGWNIGLEMAESDTVFILNADLHLTAGAVDAVENGLRSLPHAACVGPQGSFVNFPLCKDYLYFDKGSFNAPVEVDAVSGFFFAVNRRLLDDHGIRFETRYTPCYFEEWDLGLKIRRAGLKNYIIPTTGYEHHWSGSIRALRSIPYMGRDETAGEILMRNRQLFLAKWRDICRREGIMQLLDGGWREYLLARYGEALRSADMDTLKAVSITMARDFPVHPETRTVARMLSFMESKQKQSGFLGVEP